MKKLILIASLSLLYFNSQSQAVVIDAGHIVATVANGAVLGKINKTTKDINEVSNSINGFVKSINNLQHSVDNALKTVRTVVKTGSSFSNIEYELDINASLNLDLSDYLPSLNPNEYLFLKEGYHNSNITIGSNMLHHVLDIPLETELSGELGPTKNIISELRQNKQLFNVMASQKSIQIALAYNQLADVMIQKGEELNTLLKKDKKSDGEANSLKMNEAERLQLFATTSEYVRKALDLKLACDQIIRKEIVQNEATEKAMGNYRLYNSLTNYYGK